MRGFEYLEGRCGQSELSAPEIKILALIAADKRGRKVDNRALMRFGEYESAGYVKLSAALIGPLRTPDGDHFWATMTDAGRAALNQQGITT